MTWQVDFYEEEDGSAPVEDFLSRLPVHHKAKALAIKELANAYSVEPFLSETA